MRSGTHTHTRSVERYFKFDDNDKREPAILDEVRTSTQAKVNRYWERYSLDGVFDYCQNFNNSGWFLKSRTRLVDGYCFRRVDTWQHQQKLESNRLCVSVAILAQAI